LPHKKRKDNLFAILLKNLKVKIKIEEQLVPNMSGRGQPACPSMEKKYTEKV
jgi:hypothetical protein